MASKHLSAFVGMLKIILAHTAIQSISENWKYGEELQKD